MRKPLAAVLTTAPFKSAPVSSTWIGFRVYRTHQWGGSTFETAGAARQAAAAASARALHLESVIALANMYHQILSVLHPQIDQVEQAVRLQGIGPVSDVV